MRKSLILMLSALTMSVLSCKKGESPNSEKFHAKTPMHEIFDSKYIDDSLPYLSVNYKTSNPNQFLDKRTYEAALLTLKSYGYEHVGIRGSILDILFSRFYGAIQQPSYSISPQSVIEQKIREVKSCRVILTITNLNNAISQTEFEKGLNIQPEGANIGDKVDILEKKSSANETIIVFEMTTSLSDSKKVNLKGQSKFPCTMSIKHDIEYTFNNASRQIIPFDRGAVPPDNTEARVTRDQSGNYYFTGSISNYDAHESLRQYLAKYYWTTNVLPIIN